MGRHPAPTRLKVLKGVADERINYAEPIPSDAPIECPDWLPELGKQLWDDLADDLIYKRVLTFWDVPLFAALCEAHAIHREAMTQIRRDGITVEGHRGRITKHPAHQIARDALQIVITISGRFGLSPADRAQLSVGGDRPQPGDDLLTQGSFG